MTPQSEPQKDKPVMPEEPKTGEPETHDHMGRADERADSEPPSPMPERASHARAREELLEAAGWPELESIATTPDQLAAIQLAQQIRIAEALERIATALERPREPS
jgi:hypothetical protein